MAGGRWATGGGAAGGGRRASGPFVILGFRVLSVLYFPNISFWKLKAPSHIWRTLHGIEKEHVPNCSGWSRKHHLFVASHVAGEGEGMGKGI